MWPNLASPTVYGTRLCRPLTRSTGSRLRRPSPRMRGTSGAAHPGTGASARTASAIRSKRPCKPRARALVKAEDEFRAPAGHSLFSEREDLDPRRLRRLFDHYGEGIVNTFEVRILRLEQQCRKPGGRSPPLRGPPLHRGPQCPFQWIPQPATITYPYTYPNDRLCHCMGSR